MSEPGFWTQVLDRIKRLILTNISKKWAALWTVFAVATLMCWFGKVDGNVWWLSASSISAVVVSADTWQKIAQVPR